MTGQDQKHGEGKSEGPPTFFFFVDGKKYDWPTSAITGSQIRAAIPGLNPAYQVIQEGHGSDPDRAVTDNETFQLESHGRGPLHFYTAPPATFGAAANPCEPRA